MGRPDDWFVSDRGPVEKTPRDPEYYPRTPSRPRDEKLNWRRDKAGNTYRFDSQGNLIYHNTPEGYVLDKSKVDLDKVDWDTRHDNPHHDFFGEATAPQPKFKVHGVDDAGWNYNEFFDDEASARKAFTKAQRTGVVNDKLMGPKRCKRVTLFRWGEGPGNMQIGWSQGGGLDRHCWLRVTESELIDRTSIRGFLESELHPEVYEPEAVEAPFAADMAGNQTTNNVDPAEILGQSPFAGDWMETNVSDRDNGGENFLPGQGPNPQPAICPEPMLDPTLPEEELDLEEEMELVEAIKRMLPAIRESLANFGANITPEQAQSLAKAWKRSGEKVHDAIEMIAAHFRGGDAPEIQDAVFDIFGNSSLAESFAEFREAFNPEHQIDTEDDDYEINYGSDEGLPEGIGDPADRGATIEAELYYIIEQLVDEGLDPSDMIDKAFEILETKYPDMWDYCDPDSFDVPGLLEYAQSL
jgi:hypothetical protein